MRAKVISTAQSPELGMEQSNGDHENHPRQKRKAESQDNERLSKRLSLLNIEQNGTKLYVPVEKPRIKGSNHDSKSKTQNNDNMMELEDTKHKVYVYNIDDELSSDSDDDDGKLVFMPDIEKRLRENRIPPSILANKDGELAGMQVVLYSDPKSLSVPEEKDSVRKAIIEARRRLRGEKSQDSSDSSSTLDVASTAQHSTGSTTLQTPLEVDDAMEMD